MRGRGSPITALVSRPHLALIPHTNLVISPAHSQDVCRGDPQVSLITCPHRALIPHCPRMTSSAHGSQPAFACRGSPNAALVSRLHSRTESPSNTCKSVCLDFLGGAVTSVQLQQALQGLFPGIVVCTCRLA